MKNILKLYLTQEDVEEAVKKETPPYSLVKRESGIYTVSIGTHEVECKIVYRTISNTRNESVCGERWSEIHVNEVISATDLLRRVNDGSFGMREADKVLTREKLEELFGACLTVGQYHKEYLECAPKELTGQELVKEATRFLKETCGESDTVHVEEIYPEDDAMCVTLSYETNTRNSNGTGFLRLSKTIKLTRTGEFKGIYNAT
jgi:hypothetical protein